MSIIAGLDQTRSNRSFLSSSRGNGLEKAMPTTRITECEGEAADSDTSAMPCPKSPSDFEYSSSFNSRTQIRLLQFTHTANANDLALTIASHDLHCAPPFTALSYVWGERSRRQSILLNGYNMMVQKSCAYALQQLRRTDMSTYYWIDAISIDQSNVDERACQVQMMADIFSRATQVAISYGTDSVETLAFMHMFNRRALLSPSDIVEEAIRKYSDMTMEERLGMLDFVTRPYWDRLWIVQELACAQNVFVMTKKQATSLSVIFGFIDAIQKHSKERVIMASLKSDQEDEGTPSSRLLDMTNFAEFPMMQLGDQLNFHGLGRRSHHMAYLRGSLPDKLQDFGHRQCEDVRDRIYGILSLVNWPPGMSKITVDYNMSALTLARQAWAYYKPPRKAAPEPWQYTESLCTVLNISSRDSEVAQMLNLRQVPRIPENDRTRKSSLSSEPWVATSGRLLGAVDKAYQTLVLRARNNGVLVLSGDDPSQLLRLRLLGSPASSFYGEDIASNQTSPELTRPESWLSEEGAETKSGSKMLYIGRTPIGAVCQAAQAGDFLVPLPTDGHPKHYAVVVLRPSGTETFSIIGYAVLDFPISPGQEGHTPKPKREYFLLHCDVDDMLAMSCLMKQLREATGPEARETVVAKVLGTAVCRTEDSSFAVVGKWTWSAVGPTARATDEGQAPRRRGRQFMNEGSA